MRIPFLKRETPEPDRLSLLIDAFNANLFSEIGWTPSLVDNVWAANRCMQLTAQQIASMPLRFYGAPSTSEPAWLSSPDPVWFPNGCGDVVFAIMWSMYGHGDAFLLVTERYASGFPQLFTVLNPEVVDVRLAGGRRQYFIRNRQLDPDDVVQISRDPRGGLRGTSALWAYAANAWNLKANAEQAAAMIAGLPPAVLKRQRSTTHDQAEMIKSSFLTAAKTGPPVLPPDVDLLATGIGLSPRDLMLIDVLQFDARVIATAFGVPPFMLNLPFEAGLTYQSPAMLFIDWWRRELRPAARRIGDALSANMLPRGSWVEFDAKDVLAPPFKETVEAWKLIITDMGAATTAEFRASVLGLPPQSESESVDDLLTPSVAATSAAASTVTPIRPAQEARQ